MSSYSTSPSCTPLQSYLSLPKLSPSSSIRSSSSCYSNSTSGSYIHTPESFHPHKARLNHARKYEEGEYASSTELGMGRLSLASESSIHEREIALVSRRLRYVKPRSRPSHSSTSHHRRAYSLPQISQGYLLLPRRSPSPTPPSITSSRHLPLPVPSRARHSHSRTSSTTSSQTSTGEQKTNQGVMWVDPAMQAFLKEGGVAQVRGGNGRMYKVRTPARA